MDLSPMSADIIELYRLQTRLLRRLEENAILRQHIRLQLAVMQAQFDTLQALHSAARQWSQGCGPPIRSEDKA